MVETRTIPLDDLTFTVDVAGPAAAPTVLLLHGFPETRHMWRHAVAALARAGYRAVAPDQRGYSPGARPGHGDAYTTDHLVGDALALMDALGSPRFHLVGHDWGGQIAWLLAASHAHRVQSLCVLSRPHPAAFARAMQEDPAQAGRSGHHRAFREPDAIERMRAAGLAPLRVALERQGVPAARVDVYIRALLERGAIEGAMSWYRHGALAGGSVPLIEVPTLYVWGTADATVGRRAAELTSEHVRAPFRFVAVENAGHFLVDQFPEQTSALLLEHVQANR